jgi:hypothetical protein
LNLEETMKCINLRSKFGSTYRVVVGPEHEAEKGYATKIKVDPWHFRINSAAAFRAHICPWTPDRLAVCRDKAGYKGRNGQLLALPTARLEQDGDDGVTISFELSDFPAVAKIVSPIRRVKRRSPEHAEAARKRIAKVTADRVQKRANGRRKTSGP